MNEKRLREIEKTHHDMCETSEHIDELCADVRRMNDALESLAIRFKDDDYTAMLIINKGRGLL